MSALRFGCIPAAGSPGRTRTADLVVNSHPLYQLSYRGRGRSLEIPTGIDKVAPGLTVVARAPDGTIEAVEKPDHPWLYAVQWHPELTAAQDPLQQRLFNALTEAALASRQPETGNQGELICDSKVK